MNLIYILGNRVSSGQRETQKLVIVERGCHSWGWDYKGQKWCRENLIPQGVASMGPGLVTLRRGTIQQASYNGCEMNRYVG